MKKAPLIYDKAMHEARKYWRDHLETMSFDGRIALDHPRPKDGEQQLSMLEQELGGEVNALLQRLTTGNPFLLYTALLAGLKICLYKYTGEPAVTVFSSATSDSAIENLLPISSTLDANSSYKDTLLTLKNLLSSAFKYQQYPFSRMLLDMPDERRPKQLSIVASMAGFNERIPEGESDLVVLFERKDNGTKATFRFDARLYDESTVLNFFQSFSSVLRQGLSNMAVRLADIKPDYAESAESSDSASVAGESATATSDAAELSTRDDALLHQLIEAQASARPESVAVVEGERATTYKTLNQQAEQLAETLAGLGLDVRKPVVILMDAGTEMIVSMLAALKVGAAFAPVKLLSIKSSITDVLKTLDFECIVCQSEHVADLQQFRDSLPGFKHCITVEYETQAGEQALAVTAQDIVQAVDEQDMDDDSGSGEGERHQGTACVLVDERDGELKKSSVTHAELASLFRWLNEYCRVEAQDRCLLSPSLAACEQLYDTLGVLAAGASVEISDASSLKDASRLAARLLDERITLWDLPSPLMQNLLPQLIRLRAERKDIEGPRNILLSGEKQSASLAKKLAQSFPNAQITGLYSHPAVGIWTTLFPLQDAASAPAGAAIAQPIPGFEHRVLNRNGEAAPLHTKGELRIRRPLPPQEPDSEQGPTEVKTGLRAEPLPGNRLRWLRGEERCFVKYECCVELTKVEEVLCQHEHILAAEVVAVKAEPNAQRMVVAFIIADAEQVSAETARDFLVLSNSVDLIPDRFILVDEFPLTTDGSIDEEALIRRFVTSHEPKDAAHSVESEEIHRRLKAIWLEALQVDDVDEEESFFARGGNSLKATLLIARIKEEFGVDLSVQSFFRKPSTRAVAQLIEAESKNADSQPKAPEFKVVSREKYRVQLSDVDS